jgi:preprotein translocase subunit SecE
MAIKDEEKEKELDTEHDEESSAGEEPSASASDEQEAEAAAEHEEHEEGEPEEQAQARESEPPEPEGTQPAQLGATKYVHAAFFAAGILGAYLSGKILYTLWNFLAEWPTATRAAPMLLRYAEDERETFAMIAGAVIGVIGVIQTYRREHIRRWANEVAMELSKVTWPAKEIVTNGTIVVVVASAIATIYIALLDRLWAFLTNLVYGA